MSVCAHGHKGTFSFGCTPGYIFCDACGKRVTEEQAKNTFSKALEEVKAELKKQLYNGGK